MTLDEAIQHAEEVAEKYERHLKIYENMDDDLFRVEKNECKNCGEEHRQLADWLKELKQLREQEPCEDAISRKALHEALYERFHDEDAPNNITEVRLGAVRNFVKDFPSVTPARKKGKWLVLKDEYGDICEAICSCCGDNGNHRWKYCHTCGAEMEGEE